MPAIPARRNEESNMGYKIYSHKGMGAYATTDTLDAAMHMVLEVGKTHGTRASIVSDDPGEGIDGHIMYGEDGPYTDDDYAEVRSQRAALADTDEA